MRCRIARSNKCFDANLGAGDRSRLRLCVAGEMNFHALRQKTLTSALTSPRETGATAFRTHAGAKAVLLFTSALGALQGAFHILDERRAGTLRVTRPLSIALW